MKGEINWRPAAQAVLGEILLLLIVRIDITGEVLVKESKEKMEVGAIVKNLEEDEEEEEEFRLN